MFKLLDPSVKIVESLPWYLTMYTPLMAARFSSVTSIPSVVLPKAVSSLKPSIGCACLCMTCVSLCAWVFSLYNSAIINGYFFHLLHHLRPVFGVKIVIKANPVIEYYTHLCQSKWYTSWYMNIHVINAPQAPCMYVLVYGAFSTQIDTNI